MHSWPADLRLAVRALKRRPWLSAAVLLTAAIAIAANGALFSVVDGLLFRPLPFVDSGRLVAIEYRRTDGTLPEIAYSSRLANERERLRADLEASPLFSAIARAGHVGSFPSTAREDGVRSTGVDARFFSLLGLRPVLGRDFRPDDELAPPLASSHSVVPAIVIGHHFWHQTLGGDPNIIGVRELAGRKVRIIGVMGPGVKFPGETSVWVAVRWDPTQLPTHARLADGSDPAHLSVRFPSLEIRRLVDVVRPRGAHTPLVLFAAACLLTLVAWVQLAALVFAGTISRLHELGVRLALGATRGRVARQFAIENAVLALSVCLVAIALVHPLTTLLVSLLPTELTAGQYLTPDSRTLAFGWLISVAGFVILTAASFGVVRMGSPVTLLVGHLGQAPRAAERLRHTLLAGQVALTVVLLYLAGLTAHSYFRAVHFDYGFNSENVLVFTPPLPPAAGRTNLSASGSNDPVFDARYAEKLRRVVESVRVLREVPDVVAAASFSDIPLVTRGSVAGTMESGRSNGDWEEILEFEGRAISPPTRARSCVVGADFIAALGATLLAGRGFEGSEFAQRSDIAIINEAMATVLAPELAQKGMYAPLIGARLRTTWFRGRIVGVIRNLVYSTASDPALPQYFAPSIAGSATAAIAIRTTSSVDTASPAVRASLQRIWGPLPSRHFLPLRDAWHAGLLPVRAQALLLTVIAAACLPLAVIGLAGALLYSVQVRARETAIRIALGAAPPAIRRIIVLRALKIVTVGMAVGTGAGVAAGRAIAHQLFQVAPVDPLTMGIVIGGFLLITWITTVVPARLAARTDPANTLKTV